jgi:regulator of nucleoside diphosphate kinase
MSHLNVDYRESRRSASTQAYSQRSRLQEAPTELCCLTEPDVRLLEEAVAINGGMGTPIGRAVAEKLRHAELRSTIPDEYVTLNSQVIFRVNGGPQLSRVLVHWDKFCVPGLHLSLHTPWGITLLGMRTGHEATVYWRNGVAEVIKIESVAHQPKPAAAHREKSK